MMCSLIHPRIPKTTARRHDGEDGQGTEALSPARAANHIQLILMVRYEYLGRMTTLASKTD